MSNSSILREANTTTSKRKRNPPTDDDKLTCVKRLENGESTSSIAKELGVAPSTLREWKKEFSRTQKYCTTASKQNAKEQDEETLSREFDDKTMEKKGKPSDKSIQKDQGASNTDNCPENEQNPPESKNELSPPKNAEVSSTSELAICQNSAILHRILSSPEVFFSSSALPHPDLDEAVFRWFERNRQQGMFISCARLKTEATSLNNKLSNSSQFLATEHWLSCWRARYGIQYLPETLEKVNTGKMGENEFAMEVSRVLDEDDLKKCQVFNCSEISWRWKNLPAKSSEAATAHIQFSDHYVTVMAFCNADLSLKLPLIIIRRPGNVQVLENKNNLPLYSVENNEPWMFSSVLGNWFRKDFVPHVSKYLEERNLPSKAVLIVDNARFLPTSLFFGDLKTVFVPRNSTCLMRPFYPALENVKVHCKKTLIFSLALHMDCDRAKGISRHLQESITLVNLLNWIYTAWEREKGEKSKDVLDSLHTIEAFKNLTEDDLTEWLKDTEDDQVTRLSAEEAVEIVQTPDMDAYVDDDVVCLDEVIAPSDVVRCLDSVIDFFCHCRNLSETELASLRLARETANSMSI